MTVMEAEDVLLWTSIVLQDREASDIAAAVQRNPALDSSRA